jgi:hypothetical protein
MVEDIVHSSKKRKTPTDWCFIAEEKISSFQNISVFFVKEWIVIVSENFTKKAVHTFYKSNLPTS